MPEAPSLSSIGQFDVMARPEDVAAFCAALSRTEAGSPRACAPQAIPATFPVSWLTRPDIRDAIRTIPCFAFGLCIQLGQTVSSVRRIEMNAPYRMDVGWRSLDEARRTFEVHATVSDRDGAPTLAMTSTLMIASPQGDGA